ncbi:molybdopterin-guanine dinucleotide biosynthesis protein B [Nitratifractor sp.]
MDFKAIAFTGPSNSGKTTLIEKIAQRLIPERKVAIVKHDPGDKADFDRRGKDSDRFFRTGANTAVVSPERTTLFRHRSSELADLAEMFGAFDLMMVEGLRTFPLPRIGVFRGAIDESYLPLVRAVAVDDTIDRKRYPLPEGVAWLDLNNPEQIIAWIDRHAIRIK